MSKVWTAGEIRALARQTIDGRNAITAARGAYLRALVETAQVELQGNADQAAQLSVLKAVHRKFYPVVQEATTTSDIAPSNKVPPAERRRRTLERNRRTNFARSAYGTIRRWLRAPSHDLTNLDAARVTKSQLLNEAPPTRKHALTPQRIQARASRLIEQLVGFTQQIAKADRLQAASVLREAMERLEKLFAVEVAATARGTVGKGSSHKLPTARSREISHQRRAA